MAPSTATLSMTAPHIASLPISATSRFSTRSNFSNIVLNSKHGTHSNFIRAPSTPTAMKRITETHPKELNVTIHKSFLVTPFEKTERKAMFLSNIDHNLNFKISTVFFFSENPSFPPETVAQMLETAFRKLLVPCDFLAGRLVMNQQGRLEIDCNSVGAGFVVASCQESLEELGDLVSPNPDHQKLASRKLIGYTKNQPLVILQITSFRCGGFAMGMTFNHSLLDGVGVKNFLENIASLATNNRLAVIPDTERKILAARDPPRVAFHHPEIENLDNYLSDRSKSAPLSSSIKKLQSRAFYLSASNINTLKDQAKMSASEGTNHKVATFLFNVVLAHVWRCIALAKNTDNEPDKKFSIIYAVNIRRKLRPQVSNSYTGNAIYDAYCAATCDDLQNGCFGDLVQMITQGIQRVDDEYIRSAIDCIEVNNLRVVMYGDVLVSSWLQLGACDTVYPWGKPLWNSPVMKNHGNNAVIILPDIKGTSSTTGVNVVVSLQPKEMERFQNLFYKFLK